jgi:hypothetical protein
MINPVTLPPGPENIKLLFGYFIRGETTMRAHRCFAGNIFAAFRAGNYSHLIDPYIWKSIEKSELSA